MLMNKVYWLSDYLFNVQLAVLQLYSGLKQVQYNTKICRIEWRDGSTGSTTFEYHWKGMESWIGTKHVVFCSGYNEPTLFLNLQKRSLACRKSDTLLTMVYGQPLRISTCHPQNREGSPNQPPGDALRNSVGLSPGILHQYRVRIRLGKVSLFINVRCISNAKS